MRFLASVIAAVALSVCPGAARAMDVCINGPGVYGGDFDEASVLAVLALRPRCVRVNLRQDVWRDLNDVTPHGRLGLGFWATYDALVQRYLDAGIEPYILVGSEVADLAPDAMRERAGLETFARAFVAAVDHLKDRARVFEAVNEPNNWVRADYPALDPGSFARVLARVYRDVKAAHPSDPCWQSVQIVSGGLFAFRQPEGLENNGSEYLDQTYRVGIASGEWTELRRDTGSYPLDGVGYHFYLPVEDSATTVRRVRAFLDAVGAVISRHEGSESTKQLWISEFGWQSDDSPEGDISQARELDAAYTALDGEPRVAMAMWFTLQDFPLPEGVERWGLYRLGGLGEGHARPARGRFALWSARRHRALDAALSITLSPASARPGESVRVEVVATNTGTEAWRGMDRLGAGGGCPAATRANEVPWRDFSAGGYTRSATDARAFGPGVVAPGARATYGFRVIAPARPGRTWVAARMVREGVAWFGPTSERSLEVIMTTAMDAGTAVDVAAMTDTGFADLRPAELLPRRDTAEQHSDRFAPEGGQRDEDPGTVGPVGSSGGCGCEVSLKSSGALRVLALMAVYAMRRRPRVLSRGR